MYVGVCRIVELQLGRRKRAQKGGQEGQRGEGKKEGVKEVCVNVGGGWKDGKKWKTCECTLPYLSLSLSRCLFLSLSVCVSVSLLFSFSPSLPPHPGTTGTQAHKHTLTHVHTHTYRERERETDRQRERVRERERERERMHKGTRIAKKREMGYGVWGGRGGWEGDQVDHWPLVSFSCVS